MSRSKKESSEYAFGAEKMSIPTKVDNNKFNFLLSLFFIILPSLK